MIINAIIKPGSKKGPCIELLANNSLVVFVRERAVDSKANEALVKLLSAHYKVSKNKVKIIRGHTSRHKLIEINL